MDTCFVLNCQNNSLCKGGKCECLPTFYGTSCEKNAVDEKKYIVKNLTPFPGHEGVFYFDGEVAAGDEYLATIYVDTFRPLMQ